MNVCVIQLTNQTQMTGYEFNQYAYCRQVDDESQHIADFHRVDKQVTPV